MKLSHANLAGMGAIILWSLLALLTTATEGVPPFLLTALTFLIGGLGGMFYLLVRGEIACLKQPWQAWALGIGGLFGYHSAYFAALKLAPPAEVSLVNYLWPLLIVLFSSLLPEEKAKQRPLLPALLGGGMGFIGVLVLGFSKGSIANTPDVFLGYGLALLAAFIWAGYSVLSRRMAEVPTGAVAGFCLGTAFFATLAHILFERGGSAGAVFFHMVSSPSPTLMVAILLLGLGPVGAAFFLWDKGMKQGDIRFLGVISYATPILSTLALLAAGKAEFSLPLFFAILLIIGGAFLARPR